MGVYMGSSMLGFDLSCRALLCKSCYFPRQDVFADPVGSEASIVPSETKRLYNLFTAFFKWIDTGLAMLRAPREVRGARFPVSLTIEACTDFHYGLGNSASSSSV